MAYATVNDVAALLQRTFSDSPATVPTSAQVTQWIAEVDAEINAILRNHGFSPPVTDTDGFLKSISAAGGAYYAAEAVYTGEGFNASDRVTRLHTLWRDKVATLRKTPNLIQETSGAAVEEATGVPADTSEPNDEQRFKMDDEY